LINAYYQTQGVARVGKIIGFAEIVISDSPQTGKNLQIYRFCESYAFLSLFDLKTVVDC
jgi:hypothetical protein